MHTQEFNNGKSEGQIKLNMRKEVSIYQSKRDRKREGEREGEREREREREGRRKRDKEIEKDTMPLNSC